MLPSIGNILKYKVVSNVLVLACWSPFEQLTFSRELFSHGIMTSVVCNATNLGPVSNNRFLGIIVFEKDYKLIEMIVPEYFSAWYKWLLIGNTIPEDITKARYDSDITLLDPSHQQKDEVIEDYEHKKIYFEDMFIDFHGVTRHPWAVWSKFTGITVTHYKEKILRRVNFKQEKTLRIAVPTVHYAKVHSNCTFEEYLQDRTHVEVDTAIKCSYGAAILIAEALNATTVTQPMLYWATHGINDSMLAVVAKGGAELGGGILRMQQARAEILDYIMPLWPFSVGFTYLAERKSSGSMYLEPFSSSVWWSCAGAALVLALMQRITANRSCEKDEAFFNVLATCLQQDANAVPEGISGRWTFIVLSIASMLIYAYYSSAIVSALMSAGTSGPSTLRELGDSKYAIASEDYDYMRHNFFDITTTNEDLEYLKRKKKKANFYQPAAVGFRMIRNGGTAYHTDYNSLYPLLRTMSEGEICKLAYVDTIPMTLTWITAPKRSELTEVLRAKSTWVHETGLRNHEVSQWLFTPAPCQSSLLAERVNFGDVMPLVGIAVFCVFLSLFILALEILVAKRMKRPPNGQNSTIAMSL